MGSRSQHGFTLIEVVMVLLIFSILVGMATTLLTEGLNTFTASGNILNANWQGQLAVERISRDIMQIRSPSDITTINANHFAFTDINSNAIAYAVSGTNLNLTQNGNASILADGVQSITFSYFDRNGATTATASAVRYIRMVLNITKNNVNYSLNTVLNLRDLP